MLVLGVVVIEVKLLMIVSERFLGKFVELQLWLENQKQQVLIDCY